MESTPIKLADLIRLVFAHWQTYHPKSFPKVHGDLKEWKKVRDRLRDGYTVAQLCRAIDGIHVRPWNCGENPSGAIYQSLELAMRDAKHVEQFLEAIALHEARAPVLSEKTQRSVRAVKSWSQRHRLDAPPPPAMEHHQ
jgi:hypothetical protein